jgi:hypothetical protein
VNTRRGRHAAVQRPLPDLNGPDGNARLTSGTAAVLFLLLAAEGLTILRIRGLLTEHVFVGLLLVPPVLLKTGSTLWRFAPRRGLAWHPIRAGN